MKIQSKVKKNNPTVKNNSDNDRIIIGNMVVNIRYANNENRLYDSLLKYFKTLKSVEK